MSTSAARQIRDLVYDTLADEGRAPSVAELARLTGLNRAAVQNLLDELAQAHTLVPTTDGDAIRMAHPFSAAPMAFVVTPADGRDDRRWWGGCAWDSFGISAALHLDVRIDTACPWCGSHVSYTSGPTTPPPGDLAVRFPRPAAEWWNDVVGTCTMIRTFCSREHAEQWTAAHDPGAGYIASATTVWELAGPWYGDRLTPDFQPHDRATNQAILERVGLTGPFWRLP
ncbi:alkylmercury lyase family protein [Cellulomonas gilvus]|uniref:Alkylmercury lyase n=1 Tax=Cellulomonas gilvus (strain ATCC 13127 / NRRL B-14078) TaxID=593907 RepID=F8A682_CELGA|nr:organomercurial lyase [Cellulomonas gilvus]AEI12238.1 alkylmercury lyase [Cellulomonas gilvus ATCC 13127]